MKKYSNLIIVIITFIILILIFLNKELVSTTTINSFNIWFNTLVPSMFPMFILSDILINYNFIEFIPKKITHFISKLFNISNNAVLTIFISLISGFPTNAATIKKAYDLKLISLNEASHLLLFTHFANPLFILQTVGTFYLHNNSYGTIILISHISSSILLGILFRKRNTPTNNNYIPSKNNCQSLPNILSESIKKSINTLLIVSATVTSFLIISTLICHIFSFNNYLSCFIKGTLEMTSGLHSLSLLNISSLSKVILSSMIISFGGLSIHLQVISILDNIPYSNYFKGRIYQSILSLIISFLLFIIFF